MSTTPVTNARTLMSILRRLGFAQTRARGSHRCFEHPDDRQTTVPVHKGPDILRGVLRQSVTIDVGMDMDELARLL